MRLNLEPIRLSNVAPTQKQELVGHLVVGIGVAVVVHCAIKDPVLSLIVGMLAGVAHGELDAPVSQVIAGIAAA